MSYRLPDEPRAALHPGLATRTLWPMLTLLVVGPLPGFAWLAVNSWALGCREAWRHTALAVLGTALVPLGALAIGWVAAAAFPGLFGEWARLAHRLALIALHGGALALGLWIMIDQDYAEAWRARFGPPLANGAGLFLAFLAGAILLGGRMPDWLRLLATWAAV